MGYIDDLPAMVPRAQAPVPDFRLTSRGCRHPTQDWVDPAINLSLPVTHI